MTEKDNGPDPRLLDPKFDRGEWAGEAPRGIKKQFKELLVAIQEPGEHHVELTRIPGKQVAVISKTKKEDRKPTVTLQKEGFSQEEREVLDAVERKFLTWILAEHMSKAVGIVGDNGSIVPYETRGTTDMAAMAKKDLDKAIQRQIESVTEVANDESPRVREVMERLQRMSEWLDGNSAELMSAGAVLDKFYDGMAMLNAVSDRNGYNITSKELDLLFRSMTKIEGWKLGEEITNKQDAIQRTLRGIATVHRHAGRNVGKEPIDDYEIRPTEGQIEFVETIFAEQEWISRTIGTGDDEQEIEFSTPERVELLDHLIDRGDVMDELDKFLRRPDLLVPSVKVVVGKEYEINHSLIRDLKTRMAAMGDFTIWVDGVEWTPSEIVVSDDEIDARLASGAGNRAAAESQIRADKVKEILKELQMRVWSGDKVFIGKKLEIDRAGLSDFVDRFGDDKKVGIVRSRAAALENLFVMVQDPDSVDNVKRKLAVMLNMVDDDGQSLWKQLEDPDADVLGLINEFTGRYIDYNDDILDKHIVDMARIQLLHFMEGSRVGWGFEYVKDDDMGIYKRIVSQGASKTCTDISTPLEWIRSQANYKWKDWTKGMLPMEYWQAKQFMDHEPGWMPPNESLHYMGVNYSLKDLVPKFNMAFLETKSAKIKKGHNQKIIMDLLNEGKEFSEIEWSKMEGGAYYRWLITNSQLSKLIFNLTKPLDRDNIEAFYGPEEKVNPKLLQLLETQKRWDLALRDLAKAPEGQGEGYSPLCSAIQLAWANNALLMSPSPTNFNTTNMKDEMKIMKISFEEMAPKGDTAASQRMANNFMYFAGKFVKVGHEVRTEMARRKRRKKRGRRSIFPPNQL